jgi:prepilin-type N-terminal cleavage/methylation domain-containing protein
MKTKLNNKGMTLIELTVVILVLLSLISVLFIGARAWKAGSDRANCILNIRNFQTAGARTEHVREVAVAAATIPVASRWWARPPSSSNFPTCPANGTYTPAAGGNVTYEADFRHRCS